MDPQSEERLAREVAVEFTRRVLDENLPRIAQCVEKLEPHELWSRLSPRSNPVGNLVLHLEGNVRQWILCGIGGDPDRRDRDGEFGATMESETRSPRELVDCLRATVEEAAALVQGLGTTDLLRRGVFQGRYSETTLGAVLHVMEHFSGHAGQIYAFTKAARDEDLAFYDL